MRNRSGKVDRLAGVPLFVGCTRRELAVIAGLTFETQAAPGDVLCREGQTGLECFVIVEGEAKVTMAGTEMATIGPGGFFGEMALLDGGPRIATVTAATAMGLLVLSMREFDSVLVDVPHVARRMLAAMGSRLRMTDTIAVGAHRMPIGV